MIKPRHTDLTIQKVPFHLLSHKLAAHHSMLNITTIPMSPRNLE